MGILCYFLRCEIVMKELLTMKNLLDLYSPCFMTEVLIQNSKRLHRNNISFVYGHNMEPASFWLYMGIFLDV